MGLLVKDTEFFGLDIGSSGIRLVQLRRAGTHPALAAYGNLDAPGNITNSDAKIDEDKVIELVKQLVRENHISAKSVVAGLPSAKVFTTVITTPKLDNTQLAKAIRFQAEQYIPMALDQVRLDWAVLNPTPDGKNLEVLLVAAPNSLVERYVRILEGADLVPLSLEPNAIATARALAPQTNLAVAILDMGSLDSDITIVLNGAPRLVRSVAVGGTTLVRSVGQNLGLDPAQADQFTYKFGLTQSKLEGQVYKALKPTLDNMVSEIMKSVQFFTGKYPDNKLEKLMVTGATTALPELGPYLANATGLPVEFGNAWTSVSYPAGLQDKLMGNSVQYAAAVGLAGRGYMA